MIKENNRILLTGITGQIASYMADQLVEKNKVYGLIRRTTKLNIDNIKHLLDHPNFELIYGDLTDENSINEIVEKIQPNYLFNMAAHSFVGDSWSVPKQTLEVNGIGVLNLLNAVKSYSPNTYMYQASTSEMLGKCKPPQNEETPFYPRSPYGVSKLYAHWICKNYRESYKLNISMGILFNTESPRRGSEFVTQKIATAAARIKLGLQDKLYLGNLTPKRDILHASDSANAIINYVIGSNSEYVISSGKSISIMEMLNICFNYVNLNWNDFVIEDPQFLRPAEVDHLEGDSSNLRLKGWTPKYSAEEILIEMVEHELAKNKTIFSEDRSVRYM